MYASWHTRREHAGTCARLFGLLLFDLELLLQHGVDLGLQHLPSALRHGLIGQAHESTQAQLAARRFPARLRDSFFWLFSPYF